MKPRNPNYQEETKRVLNTAPFIRDIGIEAVTFSPGKCETVINLLPRHLQQDGFVHAGVMATMADHTAGTAGSTLVGSGEIVLTAEFKINFLRAAKGDRLACAAAVLKAGRHLTVVESEIFCIAGDDRKLVAKAMVSLAIVPTSG